MNRGVTSPISQLLHEMEMEMERAVSKDKDLLTMSDSQNSLQSQGGGITITKRLFHATVTLARTLLVSLLVLIEVSCSSQMC